MLTSIRYESEPVIPEVRQLGVIKTRVVRQIAHKAADEQKCEKDQPFSGNRAFGDFHDWLVTLDFKVDMLFCDNL